MHRFRFALAVLLVLVLALATGCGSDDDEKSESAGESGAKTEQSAKPSADEAAAPKRTSSRGKLLSCLDEQGFDVSHEGESAEEATDYSLEARDGEDGVDAVIQIHPSRDAANSSARRAGEERGVNAVAFGRAEFIRRGATDTEAGTIVNCVSAAYGG